MSASVTMAALDPQPIYIVVTEAYYGGGKEHIRTFRDWEVAQLYADTLSYRLKQDVRVLRTVPAEIPADLAKQPTDVTAEPEPDFHAQNQD